MAGPTALLPFQPATMTTAQLAAVSYLARYAGRTHVLYAYQLSQWFTWCETTGSTRWSGSNAGTSSCTSAVSANEV